MTQRKFYEVVSELYVLIKRQMIKGEIVFELSDRRRVRLYFAVEEPRVYLCHDPEEIKEA